MAGSREAHWWPLHWYQGGKTRPSEAAWRELSCAVTDGVEVAKICWSWWGSEEGGRGVWVAHRVLMEGRRSRWRMSQNGNWRKRRGCGRGGGAVDGRSGSLGLAWFLSLCQTQRGFLCYRIIDWVKFSLNTFLISSFWDFFFFYIKIWMNLLYFPKLWVKDLTSFSLRIDR